MRFIKKATSYVAIISLAAGGLALTGAPAASARSGPPEPYKEPSEGISVPILGLIAIAGIATIAIWQGVRDAKKKKKAEQEKELESKEAEEFEEYFVFEAEDAGGAESENAETSAPAEEAAPGTATSE
ncbi:MAG: hypothetical protein GTN49_12375 [candidate division Zixibacteria bacterium]|nr:hypothetical protein [candidate division Zixibacteria bacterium]